MKGIVPEEAPARVLDALTFELGFVDEDDKVTLLIVEASSPSLTPQIGSRSSPGNSHDYKYPRIDGIVLHIPYIIDAQVLS